MYEFLFILQQNILAEGYQAGHDVYTDCIHDGFTKEEAIECANSAQELVIDSIVRQRELKPTMFSPF